MSMTPVLLNAQLTPDAEILQQQSMRLAILALVQIAPLPAVYVRVPKRAHQLSITCSGPAPSAPPRVRHSGKRARNGRMDAYVLRFPVFCKRPGIAPDQCLTRILGQFQGNRSSSRLIGWPSVMAAGYP
jgi:hypothetical protein